MSKKISISVFVFVILAVMLITFIASFAVVSQIYDDELRNAYQGTDKDDDGIGIKPGEPSEIYDELDILKLIFSQLSYYDVDDEKTMEALLKAYVESTGDRYAEYYTEQEFQSLMSENAGEMQGIGINIIQNVTYNCIEVINVMPDSPALEAGILPGDLIISVGLGSDSQSVSAMGYSAAVSALQGVAGTKAEFVVLREDQEIEFSITRGYVTTASVMHRVVSTHSNVGVVKIMQFDLTTPKQFSEAIDVLKSKGVTKFVFDVRYNPGGDLKSIIAVLSYFLSENDVVISTKDKQGNEEILKIGAVTYSGDYSDCSVKREDIGKYRELDCIVLVNESTASAAELFASNFRDYKIAPLVGVTTYGKGSMQSILSLAIYGCPGGLRLTTKVYFPPCGISYEGIGIDPDIEVALNEAASKVNIYKLPDSQDNQLQRAIEELLK